MKKAIFQGFSVFHLCGFCSVSAFLGAFFLAAIEKDAIFAIVKTKFAVSSPSFQSNPKVANRHLRTMEKMIKMMMSRKRVNDRLTIL